MLATFIFFPRTCSLFCSTLPPIADVSIPLLYRVFEEKIIRTPALMGNSRRGTKILLLELGEYVVAWPAPIVLPACSLRKFLDYGN